MKLKDIRKTPISTRIAYLKLIAQMAAIDNNLEGNELELLERMITRFEIKENDRQTILRRQIIPEEEFNSMIKELKAKKLHYSFMMDLIAMAVVDGIIMDTERILLAQVMELLNIHTEEFHNLLNFAQIVSHASTDYPIDPMYSSVINMVLRWAKSKNVHLYQQTTFAIAEEIDIELKEQLEGL